MVDISKVARVCVCACVCATPTELDRDTLSDRYLPY